MSAERPVDPTLVQHAEAVRDELRAEQRALEELPRENARLRERIERLETRKQELGHEVEALRQERPLSAPRLPAVLSPPFEVKIQQGLRQPMLKVLFLMVFAALFILVPRGLQAWPYVAPLWGLLGVLALIMLVTRPRWRFGATAAKLAGLPLREQSRSNDFLYQEIHDVRVLVTPSQKRRDVGTVVLSRWSTTEEPWVTIRNVPEPERLAEWLRSKRDSARDRGG